MKILEYPFDSQKILKEKKIIKKELLKENNIFLNKKIAILGGSTTNNIKLILELFLLNYGIKPTFYESEYNQFWQDSVFKNSELIKFKPDIIFIHTSKNNITKFPNLLNTDIEINEMLENEYKKFENIWNNLQKEYNCEIIQNNFEYPFYRLFGNRDLVDIHGKVNYITRLNTKFVEYAQKHEKFYINDINYQSAQYGLDKWSDQFYWYMYKYSLSIDAIPTLAYNVSNIIKAIYGKNKKGMVIDLDNTLWGGVIGDDGVENIVLGEETPEGQAYLEFQKYIKEHKQMGIILNISSKNSEENAILGLKRNDCILKPEDFVIIKANWEQKSKNFIDIANELNLSSESLVFLDDNPAEREIINQHIKGVSTPCLTSPDQYIKILDHCCFFENINILREDIFKSEMYKQNIERSLEVTNFENYDEYLKSLEMKAVIKEFIPIYLSRIAQLTNKSNQFNLTTKRYTQSEIEEVFKNKKYITLYGKLFDKFGDNGVVSIIIGKIDGYRLDIDLWIMSCRVLKRNMEFAMMDMLVNKCIEKGIKEIYGYYYPTLKNQMVKDFYKIQGFSKINEQEKGNTIWKFEIKKAYKIKNKFIKLEDKE